MNASEFLQLLWNSKLFWSIALTYLIAHTIKFFVHRYRFRRWNFTTFFKTGGMPSSHTATTTALTIALGFETGPSPVFFLAALFTLIIIRDSFGLRRAVSDQADIINTLASEMKVHKKAKIILGHTPFQVFVGFVLGAAVSLCLYLL